jgi:ATP-dependent Clp endopeptidase proteolytic subunit ClpP
MKYGARALRSTRRLANTGGQRPAWYSITNAATAGGPTQVSIYDEIGFFGVSAGSFLADLKGISGDIQVSINSPGGDVFDGIAIYNQLKQRAGSVHVIVDGLAASAASFIAQAASPGKLEMAPHSQLMIHNGFSMAIGDAADLRQTADLLDKITGEIASIYAERSGKPVDYWLAKMADETWFSDAEAVAEGLADNIHGQDPKAKNDWDLSVYAKGATVPVLNADGGDHEPMTGTHTHAAGDAPEYEHSHDGDADHDLDGDGDDDSSAAGDTDHDYVKPDGSPGPKAGNLAGMFPVLAASVDSSEWDVGRAWAAGAASDDPAAFYAGICAGRKAGDPANQDAWALPYKYSPSGAANAAAVKDALSRLPQTKGLTNAHEAETKLQGLMKSVNPDYDPGALLDPAVIASAITVPDADVDLGEWDAAAVVKAAMASGDPAWYFRSVCAGRRRGDPATPEAWALPYRRTPSSPPNASAVRRALAELPLTDGLANRDEARSVLDKALKAINPGTVPDDEIDPALLSAAFAVALG